MVGSSQDQPTVALAASPIKDRAGWVLPPVNRQMTMIEARPIVSESPRRGLRPTKSQRVGAPSRYSYWSARDRNVTFGRRLCTLVGLHLPG